ncbi:MAG TPA: hypothetical protein VJ831_06555 [Jatrophihabitantaceae bacterium]|nr:hypothetical protein [Jatrophihabitantaceae bacterium]
MSRTDEELRVDPWWSSADGRRGIVLISCFVLVAVVAAWIVVDQRGPRNANDAQPNPSAPVTAPFKPLNIDIDSFLHCPETLACRSIEAVPSATSAAISQYLPGGYERRTVTVTEVADHKLHFRAVNAISGAVELLVIVSVPAVERPASVRSADPKPGASIRYARRTEGRYEIQVQFTGPPGATPPVRLATDLAADPRLLAMV